MVYLPTLSLLRTRGDQKYMDFSYGSKGNAVIVLFFLYHRQVQFLGYDMCIFKENAMKKYVFSFI